MTHQVKCPDCGIRLKIDEWAGGQDLTCPVCLAKIPDRSRGSDQPPAVTAFEPPAPARRRDPRPGEDDWADYRPEADVQRDSKSAAVLLTVLGLLIVAGGIALKVNVCLAILLFVGVVGRIAMSSRKSTVRKTGKALFFVVALIVLLPIAVIIFFFAICAAGSVVMGMRVH